MWRNFNVVEEVWRLIRQPSTCFHLLAIRHHQQKGLAWGISNGLPCVINDMLVGFPVESLLKQLPVVAGSPLAFVAYALVVCGWILAVWLKGLPERKAEGILKQFNNDDVRLEALGSLIGQRPPGGLTGNTAILEWVKEANRSRSQRLLLIAWAITLVAVIVFAVAWRTTPLKGASQVQLQFHRQGTTDDCPELGMHAHVLVTVNNKLTADLPIAEGCRATLPASPSDQDEAIVTLTNADYVLAAPAQQYILKQSKWDLYVIGRDRSRIRLSLFSYDGDCPQGSPLYGTVRELINFKIAGLRGMFSSTDHRLDYLSKLLVVYTNRSLDMSPYQIEAYSRDTASFQVLGGRCYKDDNLGVMQSRIYSGAYWRDLSEPFTATLRLDPNEFGANRDIETASMLYALAEEASERDADQDVIIGFLSRALELSRQLHEPAGQQLKTAIEAVLKRTNARTVALP